MSEENGESSDEEVIVVDDFESPTVPYVVGAVDIASSSPFYDNDCTEENLPSGNSSPSKSPVKKKVRSVPSRRNLFNIYENEPENEISDNSIMTNDNNDPRFEKNASEQNCRAQSSTAASSSKTKPKTEEERPIDSTKMITDDLRHPAVSKAPKHQLMLERHSKFRMGDARYKGSRFLDDKIHNTFKYLVKNDKAYKSIDPDLLKNDPIQERLTWQDNKFTQFGRFYEDQILSVLYLIRKDKNYQLSQRGAALLLRSCGSVMAGLSPQNRTELLKEILSILKERNFPLTITHYNIILSCNMENYTPVDTNEFLEMLTEKGIEPNDITYQRLVAKHCLDLDIEGAKCLLSKLEENNFESSNFIMNAFLYAYIVTGREEETQNILTKLTENGSKSSDTYSSMLTAYVILNDWEKIQSLFKEMEVADSYPTDEQLYRLVGFAAKHGQQELAFKKKHGFHHHARAAMENLCATGEYELSYAILNTMPAENYHTYDPCFTFLRNMTKNCAPAQTIIDFNRKLKAERNDYLYDTVQRISAAAMYDKHPELEKIIEYAIGEAFYLPAEEQKYRPSMYYPLISLTAKKGDLDAVFGWFEKAREMHGLYKLPERVTSDVLLYYGSAYIPLETLLEEMKKRGFEKSHIDSAHLLFLLKNHRQYYEETSDLPSVTERLLQIETALDSDITINPGAQNDIAFEFGSNCMKNCDVDVAARVLKKFGQTPDFVRLGRHSSFDFTSSVVFEMMRFCSEYYYDKDLWIRIEDFIDALLKRNMSTLSSTTIERIMKYVANVASRSLKEKIKKLEKYQNSVVLNESQLKDAEKEIRFQRNPANSFDSLFRMLYLYKKSNKLERAAEIFHELEVEFLSLCTNDYFPFAASDRMIEAAVDVRLYETAIKYYKKRMEFDDNNVGDIRICCAYVHLGKMTEAKELLRKAGKNRYSGRSVAFTCGELANCGLIDEALSFLFEVNDSGLIHPQSLNWSLKALVQYFLKNGEPDKALKIMKDYDSRSNALFRLLYQYCLDKGDRNFAQQVFDLSLSQNGKERAVLSFAIVLLENDKIGETAKLFEKSMMTVDKFCLDYISRGARLRKNVKSLKNLTKLSINPPFNSAELEVLYLNMLKIYEEIEDPEGANEILNEVQEKSIPQSEEMKKLFTEILNRNLTPLPDDVKVRKKQF